VHRVHRDSSVCREFRVSKVFRALPGISVRWVLRVIPVPRARTALRVYREKLGR
jgi:hypothetical protein